MKIESLENRQLLAGANDGCPVCDCEEVCAEKANEPGYVSKAWGYTGGLVIDKAVSPVASYTIVPLYNHAVAPVAGYAAEKAGDGTAAVLGLDTAQIALAAANFGIFGLALRAIGNGMPTDTKLQKLAALGSIGVASFMTASATTFGAWVTGFATPEDASVAAVVGQGFAGGLYGIMHIPGAGTAAYAVKNGGQNMVAKTAGAGAGALGWIADNAQPATTPNIIVGAGE